METISDVELSCIIQHKVICRASTNYSITDVSVA